MIFKPGSTPANKGKGKCAAFLFAHANYDKDDCLKWPFNLNDGYGLFAHLGKQHMAHRFMCELAHGAPPTPKHYAAHSCGRGHHSCVNPRHLSWKTPSENQLDRARHGTKNGGCVGKLTPEQVAVIKRLKGQKTQKEIAEMFGVFRTTVSDIHRGLLHRDERLRRSPRELRPLSAETQR